MEERRYARHAMTAGRFLELPTAYLFLPIGGLLRRAFLRGAGRPCPSRFLSLDHASPPLFLHSPT